MSDNDIINSWELVQTERERWADKLSPKKPIPGTDCCTYSCTNSANCPVRQTLCIEGFICLLCNQDCAQGDRCTARATTAAEPNWWPVLDKLPAPKHCETSKQPCATPWTCAPGCKLITTNSDGTSPDEKPLSRREARMVWLVAGGLILSLAALGIGRIFN